MKRGSRQGWTARLKKWTFWSCMRFYVLQTFVAMFCCTGLDCVFFVRHYISCSCVCCEQKLCALDRIDDSCCATVSLHEIYMGKIQYEPSRQTGTNARINRLSLVPQPLLRTRLSDKRLCDGLSLAEEWWVLLTNRLDLHNEEPLWTNWTALIKTSDLVKFYTCWKNVISLQLVLVNALLIIKKHTKTSVIHALS